MKKSTLRLIIYAASIVGLGTASLLCFDSAQYNKAKYKSSNAIVADAVSKLETLYATYPNALIDESDIRAHDKALWYNDIYEHFYVINEENRSSYVSSTIPAYLFSTLTLVAFGVILKVEEKAKEKEDNEVTK